MPPSNQPFDIHLLPQPRSLTRQAGVFTLPATGAIGIGDASLYPLATELQALFPGLAVHASYPGGVDAVSMALCDDLPRDGYRLSISPAGIRIEAGAVSGAFYAGQTLRQIVEQAVEGSLPCLEIEDWPDFADRGVYYDVTGGLHPGRPGASGALGDPRGCKRISAGRRGHGADGRSERAPSRVALSCHGQRLQ